MARAFDWSFDRRFMRRVAMSDAGCWLWTGASMRNGYGQLVVGGVHWAAHRYAYTHLVGPIEEGRDLDHLCRNRRCCNPAHLEPVGRGENLRRSPLVGRYNLAKKECPEGHAYDEANTYVHPSGSRHCRTCTNERARRKRGK